MRGDAQGYFPCLPVLRALLCQVLVGDKVRR